MRRRAFVSSALSFRSSATSFVRSRMRISRACFPVEDLESANLSLFAFGANFVVFVAYEAFHH